jgi:hypothetical protein
LGDVQLKWIKQCSFGGCFIIVLPAGHLPTLFKKMPSFTVYSYLEAAVESAINIAPGFPASSVVCSCALKCFESPYQWDFQDPKLEVPTIYKAYVRPM